MRPWGASCRLYSFIAPFFLEVAPDDVSIARIFSVVALSSFFVVKDVS